MSNTNLRYSQFNSIVKIEEHYALFNSYSQKVILLVPELKDLLLAAINEGISNLKDYHPTFYEYLHQEDFLIEEDVNEVEKVKKLVREIDNATHSYNLTINPTMNCNFKCWYCYETHIKNSNLDDQTIGRIKKFITNTISTFPLESFSLSFFGGEPLLPFEKSVIPIVDYFTNSCRVNGVDPIISFTTNGYLVNQTFINYFNSMGIKCSLQITLDGGEVEHNKVRFVSKQRGSFFEIIENVKLLLLNEFPVRLRINYTSSNIESVSGLEKYFETIPLRIKEEYLLVDYHRVWQDSKTIDISETLNRQLLELSQNDVKTTGINAPNNVLDSCYADKRNSVVINYNGDIFKCTARDFLHSDRAGFINEDGVLVWENDYLERRMDSKFKNRPCLSCRLLPICNGGCSQHAMEKKEEYCVYQGDESEKDKIVLAKVNEIVKFSQNL